ncbi:MAG: hypothetical protein PHF63_14030, partial [Herbinix sp.]|nr:hypothetical protein [Herbinix sp.]
MQNKTQKNSHFLTGFRIISAIWHFIFKKRNALNHIMTGKFTAKRIAIAAAAAVGIIMVILLFVPPYKGVADDGSLYKVMGRTGLTYIENDPEDIYNNYFIKRYLLEDNSHSHKKFGSSQDVIIRTAILLDKILTRDQYFDIRFLAFLYCIMYLPAIYLIVKYTCMSIKYFSEAIMIATLAVIIFADISFITYFNSLYPEAVWIISILYCCGAIFRMQKVECSYLSLALLGVFGALLCMTRQHCGVIGFILAGFSIGAFFLNNKLSWKIYCILTTFALCITAMLSIFKLETDFNLTSKYHAMTRGILFQAEDPEVALNEFGINPSYAVLAKTSAYNSYPFVKVDDEQLQEGFYDKYDYSDILIYYLKHPVSFLRMLDVAVKNMNSLRRSFCGNYEKSVGLPKMAQGLFWSGWSNFKVRFAPKTIGYLFLLIIFAYFL